MDSSVTVNCPGISARGAYIYAIAGHFPGRKVLYIGQTLGVHGALGRLAQHLSDSGGNTFVQRLEALGFDVADIEKVEFEAIRLSNVKTFWSKGPDYREAVESLVQLRTIGKVCELRAGFVVISRTRPNPYCRLKYVLSECETVGSRLEGWLVSQLEDCT